MPLSAAPVHQSLSHRVRERRRPDGLARAASAPARAVACGVRFPDFELWRNSSVETLSPSSANEGRETSSDLQRVLLSLRIRPAAASIHRCSSVECPAASFAAALLRLPADLLSAVE